MTLEPTETPEVPQSNDDNLASLHSSQYGSLPRDPSGLYRVHSGDSSGSSECFGHSRGRGARHDSGGGVDADSLDERLRGLRFRDLAGGYAASTPGQRISEYENALTPKTPKQGPGFQVTKREQHHGGIQLDDFPNEILTHIFSHLPPDCHSSIALVSKRFWALVTTHHAWRMAFMRYFPGHTALEAKVRNAETNQWNESESDAMRSETRYFPRLTPLATWRSEYLLRTRHLRSLARGKPGVPSGVGSSDGAGRPGKKLSAVLTYNSKLPWQVTSIHAVFSNGKKPPRVIQATGDLGAATISDPTTGKIEKWGIEDLYSAAQLEEVMAGLVPYGLGEGPAAVPNTMDVSQSYGMLVGEGFPGGRSYFRGVNESRGRYLDVETGDVDTNPDIPRISEMMDAICSVWIAKSSSVTSTTQSMCGMLTGSALGVVTAYSLGWDTTGPRYANGDITARWVLSPGVPIVSLKVDDIYSQKRKSSRRIWAVALNALGEVYYLTEAPTARPVRATGEEAVKNAWHAGRTAYWHLLEATHRVVREDDLDNNDDINAAYSPRSSPNSLGLVQDQFVAEAREIERFLRYKPAHFRKVCEGWDMQRRLEVDFASDDGKGAGESVFIIDCGFAEGRPACIQRYVRSLVSQPPVPAEIPLPVTAPPTPSLFGVVEGVAIQTVQAAESQSPRSPPPTPKSPAPSPIPFSDWSCQTLNMKDHGLSVITAVALDNSTTSSLTLVEDALHTANEGMVGANPWAGQASREVPGRRARFILVGTNDGAVIVWNARDEVKKGIIQPIRVIETESPEVSCVAASGLYVVHGGSDGLVQAWDPLSSNMDAVRTINARSNGRAPRHMMVMNPTLREANYSAVGVIFLDPDATILQGVVSFGALLRYWSYSSTSQLTGRKKRTRHSEMDSRLASRRQGGTVTGYIAAEEAEIRRENEQRARERARLLKRFGALGDLSEEEAILYAQMVSEEAYLVEEQRRASDSAADASLDTASSFSGNTVETWTPDPSVAGPSAAEANSISGHEDEYEQQIQQAIRLSLMESVSESPRTSKGASPGDMGFTIKYKPKSGKKGKQSATSSPSNSYTSVGGPAYPRTTEDDELALALSLSMQDQGGYSPSDVGLGAGHDDFPSLSGDGAGKGKGVQRW